MECIVFNFWVKGGQLHKCPVQKPFWPSRADREAESHHSIADGRAMLDRKVLLVLFWLLFPDASHAPFQHDWHLLREQERFNLMRSKLRGRGKNLDNLLQGCAVRAWILQLQIAAGIRTGLERSSENSRSLQSEAVFYKTFARRFTMWWPLEGSHLRVECGMLSALWESRGPEKLVRRFSPLLTMLWLLCCHQCSSQFALDFLDLDSAPFLKRWNQTSGLEDGSVTPIHLFGRCVKWIQLTSPQCALLFGL